MCNRKLVLTNDGSHTIYDSEIKSNFHSIHGAITESQHIFIKHGLEFIQNSKSSLRIFEMGFGTGLNAFLSYIHSINNSLKIDYDSIDSHPLNYEIVKELNYPELLSIESKATDFLKFHSCDWNLSYEFNSNFQLKKMNCNWRSFIPEGKYDLVYFDAFDPVVQPDLWDISSFEKLYSIMSSNSILCTYCAKGIVRRNLKEVGFNLESLPGPPGKREMTRASKD